MRQIVKVASDEYDGDEDGNEWQIRYILYGVDKDDDGKPFEGERFDLYTDDGRGNGTRICSGDSEKNMRSLTLRLGEFVEWGAKEHDENPYPVDSDRERFGSDMGR